MATRSRTVQCAAPPRAGQYAEVEQPGGRTDKRGQFLFAVDGSEQSPDDLFARAHRLRRLEILLKPNGSTAF